MSDSGSCITLSITLYDCNLHYCGVNCSVCAGLSEWEDDRVLAAVLAASQQEYIDGLATTASESQ